MRPVTKTAMQTTVTTVTRERQHQDANNVVQSESDLNYSNETEKIQEAGFTVGRQSPLAEQQVKWKTEHRDRPD